MQRRLLGALLVVIMVFGITVFQVSPLVGAEYACGTYGAGDFGNDCPDSTDTSDTTTPATTGSSTSSTPSSTSPQSTTTPSSTDNTVTSSSSSTTPTTNPTTQTAQQVATAAQTTPFNWWPIIISGIVLLFVIGTVITKRLRK
jgi:hypothetical protein